MPSGSAQRHTAGEPVGTVTAPALSRELAKGLQARPADLGRHAELAVSGQAVARGTPPGMHRASG